MIQSDQSLWDKAAIYFAAGLMAQPPSFTLQSPESCVYEGVNMADLFMKQRKLHIDRTSSVVLKKTLGTICHECKKAEATKYYGQHNTYPSCDDCFESLNRQFDDYERG